MSSAFAQLPAAVLSDILWLTSFVDTLRCEQVCRSWQQVLKRSAAVSKDPYLAWSPGIWGEELELLFVTPEKDSERPALKLEQSEYSRNIAITLHVSTGGSTRFHELFCMWLAEHAAGFIKVTVYKPYPQSSWLFARTVLAIGAASLSAPPDFAVHFDADFGVIQSSTLCELLGNTVASWRSDSIAEPAQLQPLTSLTCLTRLCVTNGTNLGDMTELRQLQHFNSLSLCNVSALANKVPNFTNLQSLSLSGCRDEIWDFSSCSSLTRIRLINLGNSVKQIMLPSDPQVILRELSVGMRALQNKHDYVMANINKAEQLTEVKFIFAYPRNFRNGEWPVHLPNLCNLQLTGLSCDLPSAVTSCPNLRHFAVTDHEQATLPLWLSSMTQLTYLRIDSGKLEQFPEQILQLSQLRCLLVSNTPDFVLPRSLLQCAYWPNLTSLHIDVTEASVSLESQLILLQLENLFKLHNAGCDIRFH